VKTPSVDGRVLVEALADFNDAPEHKSELLISEKSGGRQTQIEISKVGETRYLDWGRLS